MMKQTVDRGAGARDSVAQACPALRFCDREELKKPAGHRSRISRPLHAPAIPDDGKKAIQLSRGLLLAAKMPERGGLEARNVRIEIPGEISRGHTAFIVSDHEADGGVVRPLQRARRDCRI